MSGGLKEVKGYRNLGKRGARTSQKIGCMSGVKY